MRIVEVRERTCPISSPIRNAWIDFSTMTLSLVAVVTDVVRDGRPVVGYGFNSNGRYAQGALLRERFLPRLHEADPDSLLDDRGVLDPGLVWQALMVNEKPGGHGERSVAVGTVDMAVWDAVAKIEGVPLFTLLADRYGDGRPQRQVFVYAAGGYYHPGDDLAALQREMLGYTERGYTVVKMKIGGAPLDDDLRRIEAVLDVLEPGQQLAVDANGRLDRDTALEYARALSAYDLFWFEEPCEPLDYALHAEIAQAYDGPVATGENLFSMQDARNLLRHGGLRPARLAAVRLRPQLRARRVPADARGDVRERVVDAAVHPARRSPDVPEHRGRSRPWGQRVLSRPVPAVRRVPGRRRGRGRARHPARAPRHRLRGQERPVRRDAVPRAVSGRRGRTLPSRQPTRTPA
jgi:L-alanine-DL-glutamate epimerase-like enolase superfamily enzyme